MSVRPAKGLEAASVVRDLLAGVRFVVRAPRPARATLTSVVSCVGQGMLTVCLPLLGERVLGAAGQGTTLLSCAAVSALTANGAQARSPRQGPGLTALFAVRHQETPEHLPGQAFNLMASLTEVQAVRFRAGR
ncbi:hypothetical protein ACU639_02190 [Streptomyces cynarae]|uniref:hypothetical protein n=1 Tax=Streptomyces cynarae TaxID=2981134 RepID=UPI00406C938B